MKLLPGMTANVTIFTKEENNALLISAKALKFTPDETMEKQFQIQEFKRDSVVRQKPARKIQRTAGDTLKKMVIDTTNDIVPKRAMVWVKQNDILVQKRILIGLNDYTNVQVLKGLEVTEEVVTGIKIDEDATTSKSSGAPKSPFATQPQRRGGGGGGGGRR